MSLLYKDKSEVEYKVSISQENGKVKLRFTCDGGKFGTDETLDEYELTPKQLLDILQKTDHF